MRTKNKAICLILNAQVKCYCNTINLLKHLISCIRRHDALFVYYTHTKARMTLAVFSASAVSLYDDINTRISSPAALRVTALGLVLGGIPVHTNTGVYFSYDMNLLNTGIPVSFK